MVMRWSRRREGCRIIHRRGRSMRSRGGVSPHSTGVARFRKPRILRTRRSGRSVRTTVLHAGRSHCSRSFKRPLKTRGADWRNVALHIYLFPHRPVWCGRLADRFASALLQAQLLGDLGETSQRLCSTLASRLSLLAEGLMGRACQMCQWLGLGLRQRGRE